MRSNVGRNPSYTTIPLADEEKSPRAGGGSTVSLVRKAARVISPYFVSSEEKHLSRALVCLVLVLAAGHTSLSVVTSFAERDLTTALATKNQPEFFQAILKFIGIIVMAVPLQAGYYYVKENLILRWRCVCVCA